MMHLFTDRLLVSIDRIDDQHKTIFETVGKFQDACNEGESVEKINELFNILRIYLVEHFKQEEEYMLKYSYPEYAAHKERHNVFMRKLNLLDSTIKPNHISITKLVEINEFLSEAFVTHLSEIDSKLGEFLRDKI